MNTQHNGIHGVFIHLRSDSSCPWDTPGVFLSSRFRILISPVQHAVGSGVDEMLGCISKPSHPGRCQIKLLLSRLCIECCPNGALQQRAPLQPGLLVPTGMSLEQPASPYRKLLRSVLAAVEGVVGTPESRVALAIRTTSNRWRQGSVSTNARVIPI